MNLVVELGVILVLPMGWEVAAAEFVGGPVMIARPHLMSVILLSCLLRGRSRRNQSLKGS